MASSSSTLTDSSAQPTSPPTSLTAVHHLITIKLNRDNYLLWKAQIVPYLKGQHLFAFLDGSRPAPPQLLPTLLPNPDFQAWHLQDQLILSALISSLSETILAHVVKCSTSRDVWLALERMFTSHSRARIMQIHYQLATLRKGDSPIADYFHRFTNLADTLAAVDHPLNDIELISFLLAGLGSDYDSFVTSVNTRVWNLSLLKICMAIFWLMSSGWFKINPASICLLLQPTMPTRAPRIVVVVEIDSPPHLLLVAPLLPETAPPMAVVVVVVNHPMALAQRAKSVALLATPQPQADYNWYSDTGASHHLTSDLSNLNMGADEYTGTEHIRVGSGNTENTASRPE
uniref:Uncharacterized protein n=1 Tax=Fagus sylvatica TaxID=28930 RepID=A0A2N9GPB1_FAGSY